jgi:uncharacterized membrane protein YtjA (UPF0391 family)
LSKTGRSAQIKGINKGPRRLTIGAGTFISFLPIASGSPLYIYTGFSILASAFRGIARHPPPHRSKIMLNWIVTFFILAVLAAFLGFTGLAGTFAEIAKFIAIVFVVLFIASLVYRMITGRSANPPL